MLHSEDGLDEISIAAPTRGFELKAGEITPIDILPEALGHGHDSLDELKVDTADASAALIREALTGGESRLADKARSIIALNAGAGVYVAGMAADLKSGVEKAEAVMASGKAAEKLNTFVAFTQELAGRAEGNAL